jgi:copper chaperone CopZ
MTTTTLKRTTLRSKDLNCPSCVGKIERALGQTPGVTSAKVHFSTGRIVVEHDPAIAPVNELIEIIGRVGYVAKATGF